MLHTLHSSPFFARSWILFLVMIILSAGLSSHWLPADKAPGASSGMSPMAPLRTTKWRGLYDSTLLGS